MEFPSMGNVCVLALRLLTKLSMNVVAFKVTVSDLTKNDMIYSSGRWVPSGHRIDLARRNRQKDTARQSCQLFPFDASLCLPSL